MKKLTFFSLFFLSYHFANAQTVGLRAFVNFANWSSSDPALTQIGATLNNATGFGVAVPLEIKLSDRFSLQPEVMYIQKGSSLSFAVGNVVATGKTLISHLELPILLKVNLLGSESPVGIGIIAGPSFAYALSGTTTASASGQTNSQSNDVTFKDYQRFEVGAHLGLNVGFGIGSGKLVFDARYLLGISDLNTGPNSTSSNSVRNRGISVGLGYMFSL